MPTSASGEALHAIATFMERALDARDPGQVADEAVHALRRAVGAEAVALCHLDPWAGRAAVVAADPAPAVPPRDVALGDVPDLRVAVVARAGGERSHDADPAPLRALVGWPGGDAGHALVVPVAVREGDPYALVVLRELPFDAAAGATCAACAAAAATALTHLAATARQAARAAEQAALRRAAQRLTAHLDVHDVVRAICHEARAIIGADYAAVYLADEDGSCVVEADVGFPTSLVGLRLAAGQGAAGGCVATGEAQFREDYLQGPNPGPADVFGRVRTAYAVPLHWDGAVRGALSVGFFRTVPDGRDGLPLLEGFAELASAAHRNATTATSLAVAARTDALTGCLNQGAFRSELDRELARAERTGRAPALVMFDLDRFKAVNDEHGHQAGDDVLRATGEALRAHTRPYDLIGRLGGDEFGVLVVDDAPPVELARRVCADLRNARHRLGVGEAAGGTAGVARWAPGMDGGALVRAADDALLAAKRTEPGTVGLAPATAATPAVRPRRSAVTATPPDRVARRVRSLTMANALGARIAGMTAVQDIARAVVEELHAAFDFHLCAVIRIRPDDYVEAIAARGHAFESLVEGHWSQNRQAGMIGRCLRERAPVRVGDVGQDDDYNATSYTEQVRSECVVPLFVGGELWGAINTEETEPHAFDEDDERVLVTVADQVGAAIRSATLIEQLDRAWVGTAQALATALELKDGYTAHHAEAVGDTAERVGRTLGLRGTELRDLRLGAALHDIGKLAVPEAILNKPGPLTAEERAVIERHTVAGDHILAPVDLLAGVRRIVRHSHERWDGAGYPDGLAAEAIPLGARIVFCCDAFDAMTTDRSYRAGMPPAEAAAELRRHAGTQFDPRVVEAFLAAED